MVPVSQPLAVPDQSGPGLFPGAARDALVYPLPP